MPKTPEPLLAVPLVQFSQHLRCLYQRELQNLCLVLPRLRGNERADDHAKHYHLLSVEGGKLMERWVVVDLHGLLEQLWGVLPEGKWQTNDAKHRAPKRAQGSHRISQDVMVL